MIFLARMAAVDRPDWVDRRNEFMPGTEAARLSSTVVLAVSLICSACLEVRDDGEIDDSDRGCAFCHPDLGGAHSAHLYGKAYGLKMDCPDCHPSPSDWFVDGHIDAKVDVRFPQDGLAAAGGSSPVYDGVVCSDVYCHGASLTGAEYSEPVWLDNFSDGLECSACHGDPPPDPHVESNDCLSCHGAAYTEQGGLDSAVHIDGAVDLNDDGANP